jgi:hypothetical protein
MRIRVSPPQRPTTVEPPLAEVRQTAEIQKAKGMPYEYGDASSYLTSHSSGIHAERTRINVYHVCH